VILGALILIASLVAPNGAFAPAATSSLARRWQKRTLTMSEITKDTSPSPLPPTAPPTPSGRPARALGDDARSFSARASGRMADSAEGAMKATVHNQASRSAKDLADVARALRKTSKELENNMASPYVDMAADQIDRASTFLRRAELKDVLSSAESFAKREPLIFLSGAFLLGLVGSRFLKSSSAASAAPTRPSYPSPTPAMGRR